MSSLPSLTAITNGNPADASEVDGNFDTVATFVDAELINRDGSIAMAADLAMGGNQVSGVGTPAAATDAATKGYVDGKYPYSYFTATQTMNTGLDTVTIDVEVNDDIGLWDVGSPANLVAPADGVYLMVVEADTGSAFGAFGFYSNAGGGLLTLNASGGYGLVDSAAFRYTSSGIAYLRSGDIFYAAAQLQAGSASTDFRIYVQRLF